MQQRGWGFYFLVLGNSGQMCRMILGRTAGSSTCGPSLGFVICWLTPLDRADFIVLVI